MTDVTFLGYPDGRLAVDARAAPGHRPADPPGPAATDADQPRRCATCTGARASHPDHLAIGEATLCAVYPDARNPFAHPELLAEEGLEAWAVPEVWMTGGSRPTTGSTSPTRSS